MRKAFAGQIISRWNHDDVFFITGDLGFMVLEQVRSAFGARFINAGVAEQNMVGVAAGLAREGHRVFVYSIAPFCYARPFEQIRNDICMTNLPICLVGNGGGYAYGHMGPTHHALEDCAVMNGLGVHVLVPAFDEDLGPMLSQLNAPTYLRLGYDARPADLGAPAYAPWRKILPGAAGAFVALGPLAGIAWDVLRSLPESERPALWAVSEPDPKLVPAEFIAQATDRPLYVIEEHVAAGGLGMQIAYAMQRVGCAPSRVVHRHALGYPSGHFGSQAFHRAECGLDATGIFHMFVPGS